MLAQSAGEGNSPSPSFLTCIPPHKNIAKGSDTEAYAGSARPEGRYVIQIPVCLTCLRGYAFQIISFRFMPSDMKWSISTNSSLLQKSFSLLPWEGIGYFPRCMCSVRRCSLCWCWVLPWDRSVSLGGIHGTGNFTPVFGTNWRALLSPPNHSGRLWHFWNCQEMAMGMAAPHAVMVLG